MPKKDKKITLTAAANSSVHNKTGAWRTKKPVTDYAGCIGCSRCAKLCPEGCIIMKEQPGYGAKLKPVTDYDYCKGCALCAQECPAKVITMEKDYA